MSHYKGDNLSVLVEITNINTKSAIASIILMAIFILIDLSFGRLGDYQCLVPLEVIVCTMLGELYPNYAKTYSRKRQKN